MIDHQIGADDQDAVRGLKEGISILSVDEHRTDPFARQKAHQCGFQFLRERGRLFHHGAVDRFQDGAILKKRVQAGAQPLRDKNKVIMLHHG